MMDWLKYSPLTLREYNKDQQQPTPKGPSFAKAKTMRFRIGGSELSFKAPKHQPTRSNLKPFDAGNSKDLLEFRFYRLSSDVMPDDTWMYQSVFRRTFAFYGPWFSGPQYQLDMAVTLLTQRTPQEGVSFFHPRAFENVLADYLTSLYGHDTYEQKIRWLAPVNWSPMKTLPVPAVMFNILPAIGLPGEGREQLLCFPVSDKHILKLELTHMLFANSKEREKLFDFSPMGVMANQIINSFSLKLSPQIQAQLNKVKVECPDMSLVKDFPPLKWTSDGKIEQTTETRELLE